MTHPAGRGLRFSWEKTKTATKTIASTAESIISAVETDVIEVRDKFGMVSRWVQDGFRTGSGRSTSICGNFMFIESEFHFNSVLGGT